MTEFVRLTMTSVITVRRPLPQFAAHAAKSTTITADFNVQETLSENTAGAALVKESLSTLSAVRTESLMITYVA